MTDEQKQWDEWVTVKIPKKVRDEAQQDPRPYHQIMTAGMDDQPATEDDLMDRIDELHEQIPDKTANEVETRIREMEQ